MTKLRRLHEEQGQSPWLDNLTRTLVRGGTLKRLVADGVRGVTANPTIFANAIEGSDASLARYGEVIEAYLAGLERLAETSGDLSGIHSVASFFVSRIDVEVDRQIRAIDTSRACALMGLAGIAQAKLAYQSFQHSVGSERWANLAAMGARLQRPLWASTSTKNPDRPDTLHVDGLIGPNTINTLPETTINAFNAHGTLARTLDIGVQETTDVVHALADIEIDIELAGATPQDQAIQGFERSYAHILQVLNAKPRPT